MMITLLIAFAVGIVLGKAMLPVLHKLKFGQNIYELAPEAHKKKQGTPTMGGLVIAGAAIAAALVMNDYSVPMGQNMLLAMLLITGCGEGSGASSGAASSPPTHAASSGGSTAAPSAGQDPSPEGELTVTVFQTGKSDCILIETAL